MDSGPSRGAVAGVSLLPALLLLAFELASIALDECDPTCGVARRAADREDVELVDVNRAGFLKDADVPSEDERDGGKVEMSVDEEEGEDDIVGEEEEGEDG